MKNLTILLTAVILIIAFNSQTYAQINVNKIKTKTEKNIKTKLNNTTKTDNNKNEVKEEVTEEDNSNDNTNNTNNNSNVVKKEESKPEVDQEYIDFVNNTASMLKSYDGGLCITNIQRGNYNPGIMLNSAKKLDYPNALKTLKEKGREGVTGYKYDDIFRYEKQFRDVYNSNLKGTINRYIEEAYTYRTSNSKTAIEKIEDARNIAEAVILIIPDEESAKKLLQDAQNSWNDIAGEYYKEVFTSEFHKENAGKILFSKTPVVIGKEDPAQFISEFSPNDHIYAVIYLKSKIKDLGTGSKYTVTIDGASEHYISFAHNKEDYESSYYFIEILPDPNVALHKLDPVEFGKILSKLSPRGHEMKIEMSFGYGQPVAEGTANLNWAGADGEAITANANLASKNAEDNWVKHVQLPEIYTTAHSSFSDPNLTTTKIKSLFISANSDVSQVLKVKVTEKIDGYSDEWMIFKNSVDIPTYKKTTRYAYIAYKTKDGTCYFTDGNFFYKDYEGAGKWSGVKVSGAKYTRIDCGNIK